MRNYILKSVFVFLYKHCTVSKHTNDVLKEGLQTLLAILITLLLCIDWDKTMDNLEVLK